MLESFKQLTKEIKRHDRIILMAHQNLDFDALGSSLCLYEIIESFEKEVSLFLDMDIDKMDSGIRKAFFRLENRNLSILYPNHYKEYLTEDTLLIILDTHKKERLACPSILDSLRDVIVLDHHIKGSGYIKDTLFTYMNSGLSSMTEFAIHYAKYLNRDISPIVSTIMLTGITIDTNEYRMKVTEDTFLASALLMRYGADNITKLEFLRESKDDYLKRLDFVKKSDIVKKGISFCILDNSVVTPRDLAIISESLLQFDEIEAAFTIGRLDSETVGISARSLGTYDVEEVMKKLGGGGHAYLAACQLKHCEIEEARQKLLETLGD